MWVADVTRLPADAVMSLLSDEERGRAGNYQSASARELFVASRALQRLLGGRYLDRAPASIEVSRQCQLCERPGQHGRPFLPDAGGLDFSVSHSGSTVALAYSWGCRVGLDLEVLDRRLDVAALSERVLSDSEAVPFHGMPEDAQRPAFLRLWTRKEAVLKLTGHGLAVPLSEVHVAGDTAQVSPVPDGWPETPIWLTDLAFDDTQLASLASTVADPQVSVRTTDELLPLLG